MITIKQPATIFICLMMANSLFISCEGTSPSQTPSASALGMGYAEVNYTPRIGLGMVGNYRGDDYASRGIHDSLYAKAIVARGSDGFKTAILSVDICNIKAGSVAYMRNAIAAASDLLPDNILIHATHTHSGPESKLDAPEAKVYLAKAAGAVITANNNIKPSELFVGRTTEHRVSHNRRLKAIDGTTHMVWETFEPDFIVESLGSIDPEMITIGIQQQGELVAALINFGCHPTTLTGNNWLYSADYPGYIAEAVQKVKGQHFGSMFINGACGNVTQVDHKAGFIDTYQECQRIGYILGVAALEAINTQKPLPENAKVVVAREKVPIKKISISEEQYQWAKGVMDRVAREGMPPLQADGIPDELYAKKWLEMYEVQNEIDSLEVMVMQIGELAVVGLPGEMFNEFGVYIKKNSPFENTLVMGLANDAAGYFPTRESFTQGPEGFTPMITGYETTPGTTYYEVGAGELLSESAVRQLKALAAQ